MIAAKVGTSWESAVTVGPGDGTALRALARVGRATEASQTRYLREYILGR